MRKTPGNGRKEGVKAGQDVFFIPEGGGEGMVKLIDIADVYVSFAVVRKRKSRIKIKIKIKKKIKSKRRSKSMTDSVRLLLLLFL